MTEDKMISSIKQLLKEKGIRVPNPDYRETHMFSAQWRIVGGTYYYQLPNKGLVIATMKVIYNAPVIDGVMKVDSLTPVTRICEFCAEGFNILELI
jgi:hypothetical protein